MTMFVDIAKISYMLTRTVEMLSHRDGGPSWDAMTTKERNHLEARAQEIADLTVAGTDIGVDGHYPGGTQIFAEVVKWLVPVYRLIEGAHKRADDLNDQMLAEQTGALLYIAAMVKRFGGETGIVQMSTSDMEAAHRLELMRFDEPDGGLILKVEEPAHRN